MHLLRWPKTLFSSAASARGLRFLLFSSAIVVFYAFFFSFCNSKFQKLLIRSSSPSSSFHSSPTSLEHIVFGIASSAGSWTRRKELVRLWWNPEVTRGCVFVESMPESNDTVSFPPVCVSGDTSGFRYTYRGGSRSAIRVARVVKDLVNLNQSDVRWFVFADDDTVFFPENLAHTLGKYDHELWYYIGTNSEIYEQNRVFSFNMAFGGAGYALSAPLAKTLAGVVDSCLERYPYLYGSDSRVFYCLTELGVQLTREPGFHQMDVRAGAYGFLAGHPLSLLVSLHHLDHLDPIFPNMTVAGSLRHLFAAAEYDAPRILHRSVCYDRWYSWTISISWGYSVEVFPRHVPLPEILPTERTFRQWKNAGGLSGVYMFNTREAHPDRCRRPVVFFLSGVSSDGDGIVRSRYRRSSHFDCWFDSSSPINLDEVVVMTRKMRLETRSLPSPRRQCCHVSPSSAGRVMEVVVRDCGAGELIHMH